MPGRPRFELGHFGHILDTRVSAVPVLRSGAVLPIIREVHGAGVTSLSGVARALNARGVKTARARVWEATTVRNVLRRGDGEVVS